MLIDQISRPFYHNQISWPTSNLKREISRRPDGIYSINHTLPWGKWCNQLSSQWWIQLAWKSIAPIYEIVTFHIEVSIAWNQIHWILIGFHWIPLHSMLQMYQKMKRILMNHPQNLNLKLSYNWVCWVSFTYLTDLNIFDSINTYYL